MEKLRVELEKAVSQSPVMGGPQMLLAVPVAGAPYSADEVTEFTQTLGDGTRIHREDKVSVYRDGQGRTRRETPNEITIMDPVAGVSYSLDPKNLTGRKMKVAIRGTIGGAGGGAVQTFTYSTPFDASVKTFAFSTGETEADAVKGQLRDAEIRLRDVVKNRIVTMQVVADPGNVATITDKNNGLMLTAKGEALGPQSIEGVLADGTRNVQTIEAGAIGNDRPLQVVNERWYSSELKTVVMTKRSDPRTGDEVFRLTNVRRGEPGANLFQPPAGYQMSGNE